MEKKKNNNILYGGLAILGIVGIASISGGKKPTKMLGSETFQDNNIPTPSTTPFPTPSTTTINKSLILKNGSKGLEVLELQKLLGITADGIFGSGTETALFNKKGVKQTSLNAFLTTPDRNLNPLKVGDKLMANNKEGTVIYIAIKKADGTYYTNWEKFRTIDFGQNIGILKSMDSTKNNYSIYYEYGNLVCFVKAKDVKKY